VNGVIVAKEINNLRYAHITEGPVFRAIRRGDHVLPVRLSAHVIACSSKRGAAAW
jgi:hypothetical protein